MLRRRRRGSNDEGESLDDMLKSVPEVDGVDEDSAEEADVEGFDENGVRIPSGMVTEAVFTSILLNCIQWKSRDSIREISFQCDIVQRNCCFQKLKKLLLEWPNKFSRIF